MVNQVSNGDYCSAIPCGGNQTNPEAFASYFPSPLIINFAYELHSDHSMNISASRFPAHYTPQVALPMTTWLIETRPSHQWPVYLELEIIGGENG